MNEELKIFITAQIDGLKKELQEAQKETKETAEKGSSNFKKFGEAAKAAGKAIGAAMKAAAVAIAAAATALVAVAESTREYRTEQAKLVTAFESAGASAEQAKETYNDLYRVLGDSGQATEAANHLALLTQNEQDLAEWTNICQGVYATFGDSLPIEGLTEAANETAKVGTVTGSLADALNWAGISEDEFNAKLAACNSEAEREKLIRETLNGVYSEAAANYEQNAASILAANEAQAKLTAGLAALGEVVEPIVTLFKSFAGDVLQSMIPGLELVSQGLQDMINGVDGGAEKLQAGIGDVIGNITGVISEALPTLITVGSSIILSLLEGIVAALPQLISSVVSAIPGLIRGILQCLPAIIKAVTQLISELAKALPDIMQVIVDELPTIIQTLMDGLIEVIPNLVDGITQAFVILCENIDAILQPLIDALPDLIITIIEALMSNLPAVIGGLITLILAIVRAIPQIIQGLVDALPTVISLIISGLLGCLPQIIGGLLQIVLEIVIALPQIFASLIEGVINTFIGIWNGVKDVFKPFGEFFGGLWDKIKSAFSSCASWFGNIFKQAWQGIKNAFSSVGSFFTNIWNNIKNIFSKVGTSIAEGIKKTVSTAVNKVLSAAVKIINGFISAINFAIDIINKIPGVSISRISPLSVPAMAKGGIVDSATLALIGERGTEAVVPLENNLEWLDKMAGMLSERMGGGSTPIIIEVDGKVFGQTAINTINQNTRQTGRLALTW